MNIKIKKENEDKFLILFSDEKEVKGLYLSKIETKKLKANLEQMLEYDLDAIGDDI
jgi:hypothetical protein